MSLTTLIIIIKSTFFSLLFPKLPKFLTVSLSYEKISNLNRVTHYGRKLKLHEIGKIALQDLTQTQT